MSAEPQAVFDESTITEKSRETWLSIAKVKRRCSHPSRLFNLWRKGLQTGQSFMRRPQEQIFADLIRRK